jgi:hypothetical protein
MEPRGMNKQKMDIYALPSSHVPIAWCVLRLWMGYGLHMCRIATDTLNKQSQRADMGWG